MSLIPPWVNEQGAEASSDVGWVERYDTGWQGDNTNFLTGGHGTTATFEGVTWTAHINQTSGNGADKFITNATGLEIDADYQTRTIASSSNPQFPMLYALIDDLVGGSWDGLSSVCFQAKVSFADINATTVSAGLFLWDATEEWVVWNQYAQTSSGVVNWQARLIGTTVADNHPAQASAPVVLEVQLLRGGLVEFFTYTSWSGDWPTPGSGTRQTDGSAVLEGDLKPGNSANRAVDATTTRVAMGCTNNNASGTPQMLCEQFRALEWVD